MSNPKKRRKTILHSERSALERQLISADIPESLRKQVLGHTFGGPMPVDCVLCGGVISNAAGDQGCDPYPLAYTGECCNSCNRGKVIPAKRGLFDTLSAAIDASCRKAIQEALDRRNEMGGAK
jgi:hypothetical protein